MYWCFLYWRPDDYPLICINMYDDDILGDYRDCVNSRKRKFGVLREGSLSRDGNLS